MKSYSIFFIVMTLFQSHFLEASLLYDRLMTQKLFQETGSSVVEQESFKKKVHKLNNTKKDKVLKLGRNLQTILPPRILESYLLWRYISPNDDKAIDVLKHALLYRLLILRDVIDSPQSNNAQKESAESYLKKITRIPEIKSDNIWTVTHQLINHKAKVLHGIKNDELLALAIKETPWFAQQLHIPKLTRYTYSPLGFLKIEELHWITADGVGQQFQSLLNELNEQLIIEAHVFLQFPSIEKKLKDKIKQNKGFKYHIIFHTPKDKKLLIDWENFRSKNQISKNKLVFKINPQVLKSPPIDPAKTSIEAAPLFPRELDPITSLGGLINIDPLSQNATTIFTGPLPIPTQNNLLLKGQAAASFVLANPLTSPERGLQRPSKQESSKHVSETIRPARLLPKQNIFEIRPLIVDMISKAQKSILIDQFFIFDAHIIQSLIKRKIQKPELSIKIFMDHNMNFSMGGFPNTLFLLDMLKHGIQVKSRKQQEASSAIVITDSQVGLIGTQNLIPTQLEEDSSLQAVQVFGSDFLKPRVADFKADWDQTRNTFELNIKEFQFTTPTQILDRNDSKLLNAIGAEFLRQYD